MIEKNFKIAIGMKIQEGPWGGGNQFGKALKIFLVKQGVKVVHSLKDNDIDVILITETRKWLKSCAFDTLDVLNYLKNKPNTLVVFRVNECDERKGNKIKLLNKLILETAKFSDKVIFISSWLRDLFVAKESTLKDKSVVIYNGADPSIFNWQGRQKWDKNKLLKIVTHHWGANWMKGFDIYLLLDALIDKRYKDKIQFSYIGNLPKGVLFKKAKVISPKFGGELAAELKKNHIYLTASINEPAGMHHIEGALCGLPILYRNSGSLPEYCKGFGISFKGSGDFRQKLDLIMEKYDYFFEEMEKYNLIAKKMSDAYYKEFLALLSYKDKLYSKDRISQRYRKFYILKNILRFKEIAF